MDPRLLLILADAFNATDVIPAWEHTAEQSPDIKGRIQHLVDRGYNLLKGGESPTTPAFLQHQRNLRERIEIVPPTTPAHIAYSTTTIDDWAGLSDYLARKLELEVVDSADKHGFRMMMLKHTSSGSHVQIIWRQKELFLGVFEEEPVAVSTRV